MNKTMLRLHLFGSFQLVPVEDSLVNFRGNKARALLAYLVLQNGQPVPRQQLINLLWAGYPPASAKTSLRVTLSNLRQLLPPGTLLDGNRQVVQLNVDEATWWCDAVALELVLASADKRPSVKRWAEVQQLYRGEFLAGFDTIDSQPFQTWLHAQRASYRQQLDALRLVAAPASSLPNNLDRTVTPFIGRQREMSALQNLLTHPDYPLVTIVGAGGVGKTRLALSVAKTLAQQSEATHALPAAAPESTAVRQGDQRFIPRFADGIWFVPLADVVPSDQVAEPIAVAIGSVLQVTFQRKESLITQLIDYLREKTMLLILDNFEHLVTGADFLRKLLQAAPNLRFLITSRQRLHLQAAYFFPLGGLPISTEEGDHEPLTGADQSKPLQTLPSVQLFLERARRTNANFRPNQHIYADIAAICRLVDGLPLAIELAAAQVAQRSCSEIRRVLTDNSTLLSADLLDLPPRHRSLQRVLADSWQLLSQTEAQVLTQCTIFQGGFTAEAVSKICGVARSEAGGDLLAQLLQKSLLQLTHSQQGERYILHDLVRRYASTIAQQANEPQMRAAALRYCHYYLAFVQAQEPVLQGENPQQAITQIRTELINIQAAWQWALQEGEWQRAAESSSALADFYQMVGLAPIGEVEVAHAVHAARSALLQPTVPTVAELAPALARFLCTHAQLLLALGRDEEAMVAAQEAITLVQAQRYPALSALAFCYVGIARLRLGEPALARVQLEQALALAPKVGYPAVRIKTLHELGYWEFSEAHYANAIVWYEAALAESRLHHYQVAEVTILSLLAGAHHAQNNSQQVSLLMETALQLARQMGIHAIENNLLNNLALTWAMRGDYSQALHYFTQALTVQRTIGHRINQTNILCNIGTLRSRIGDYAAAFDYTQQAYQLMQIIGYEIGLATALSNLGLHAHNLGDHQTAVYYSQQAIKQCQQVQNRDLESDSWNFLGDALMSLGQLAEAAEAYNKAVTLARQLALPALLIKNMSGLVRVSQAQGEEPTKWLGYVEEILIHLAPLPIEHLEDSFDVLLTCYQVLATQADRRADPLLQEAYQHLQTRAMRISDEAMRHSFLTQVPAHRELIALMTCEKTTKAHERPLLT